MITSDWCQIWGDGEECVILFKDGSGVEYAYSLKKPIVHSVNVTVDNNIETLHTLRFSTDPCIRKSPGLVDIDLGMKSLEEDISVLSSDNGGLLLDLDFFRKFTVRDLLKQVNKRLKLRESKNG